MRMRQLGVLLAVLAAVAGAASAHTHHARGAQPRLAQLVFRSRGLSGPLHLEVYLPRDYATSGLTYPVVYFLHGLPTGPRAYRHVGWLARALDSLPSEAILVAPQGARDSDSDPEYLDWGPGHNWETAMSRELPGFVDSHFRTIRARLGRGLVGLSAGGYGAVNLALHHLDDFAVVESWSGYFHPTNPEGTAPLDLGSAARNRAASAHSFVAALSRDMTRRPTFFAFYVGDRDWRFRGENERLDRELNAAHVPHLFVVYPGAHERTVWATHARRWLQLAVDHLAQPR